MKCSNYKCKKDIPYGTKKCPHCGWEDRKKTEQNKDQSSIALTVSRPEPQADGSFNIYIYAIAKGFDGSLVDDGHRIFFHTDELIGEVAEETGGSDTKGRADFTFHIPASRAGENITITAHTQIGNKRYESTKQVQIPKAKPKPPEKKPTSTNFFSTYSKYKRGGKK